MPRRVLQGTVVSDKMDKTITVLVERKVMHQKYKKYVKMSAKYAAHDEGNVCKEGDAVSIEECRPISARKSWIVLEAKGADGTVRQLTKYTPTTAPKNPRLAGDQKKTVKATPKKAAGTAKKTTTKAKA